MADRLEIFRHLLAGVRPAGVEHPRLVDLGTGHGKFAGVAREEGWEVIGVDARTERLPQIEGVTWVVQDVREYPLPEADCIAILGLLYHLDLPSRLDLLRRASRTAVILDTHVALECKTTEQGYEGRYFWEDRSAPTASVGNEYSFWPTRDSLHQMLLDCGFEHLLERVPWYREDRTFWICG